jgi:hypothetical protein
VPKNEFRRRARAMIRASGNIPFAYGTYSASAELIGTEAIRFKSDRALDTAFGCWLTMVAMYAVDAVNELVLPGSIRGEDHIRSASQAITHRFGGTAVTLEVIFMTDVEGLDDIEVAKTLSQIASQTSVILDVIKPKTMSGQSGKSSMYDIKFDTTSEHHNPADCVVCSHKVGSANLFRGSHENL